VCYSRKIESDDGYHQQEQPEGREYVKSNPEHSGVHWVCGPGGVSALEYPVAFPVFVDLDDNRESMHGGCTTAHLVPEPQSD
jgi:hypothetical protein